ncbi:MAG: LacI family DNA-binding transcriptional regulator [Eubacteriales bacterium]
MSHKKISIKQISELAGVSVATVSRVINQNGRFSKETEKRVLDIIEKYQYKPNLIARGLRTNNSLSIGVIVPDITNEFFAKMTRELETYFFQKGYTVIVCNSEEDPFIEDSYYEHLLTKGVVGMVYLSGKTDKRIRKSQIPTVFIDRILNDETDAVFIESDNVQGGYLATKELIEHHCKNILLVRDKRSISPPEKRQEGYVKALKEANIPLDPNYIIKTQVGYETAKSAIQDALNKKIPFDGVFATTDWMALGVINGIREFGLSIPEDVKVVGYDNISISEFSYIPFTTIHQDVIRIAELAVSSILRLIDSEEVPEKHILVPVMLVKRSSV